MSRNPLGDHSCSDFVIRIDGAGLDDFTGSISNQLLFVTASGISYFYLLAWDVLMLGVEGASQNY